MADAQPADWKWLLRAAHGLIAQVNSPVSLIDNWALGGGTALMLRIDHRESHDVDIFLDDAQLLGFLNPETHDFSWERPPSGWDSDGHHFAKFAFAGIGEIDFIVAAPRTLAPSSLIDVEGHLARVETVAEVIAKKVYFRGAQIAPRDIFDIAAASLRAREDVSAALSKFPGHTRATLDRMNRLSRDFVSAVIEQLIVKDDFLSTKSHAFDLAHDVLAESLGKNAES